jgi:hypothetical protein
MGPIWLDMRPDIVGALLVIRLLAWVLFLLPTLVALFRKRRNLGKIIAANVFLGPLIIPWFFVLRSAFKNPPEPITETYICTNCHTVAVPLARKRKWFFGEGAYNAAKIYEGIVPNLTCPACSSPNPIPLSSPAGQELLARSSIYQQAPAAVGAVR